MNKYLLAIHENVCSICTDSTEQGKCLLTEDEICAVEKHLEKIVHIVHSLKSDDIFDYVSALREKICSKCRAQDKTGKCQLREDANCALDRYFPLIVETIQKVDKFI